MVHTCVNGVMPLLIRYFDSWAHDVVVVSDQGHATFMLFSAGSFGKSKKRWFVTRMAMRNDWAQLVETTIILSENRKCTI